jgi:hypothetical protein
MHPMSSHLLRHTPSLESSLSVDRNSPVQRAGSSGTTVSSDFYLLFLSSRSLELLWDKRLSSGAQKKERSQGIRRVTNIKVGKPFNLWEGKTTTTWFIHLTRTYSIYSTKGT